MPARREQFVNNASTTLDGAINNSVTSITVDDGSVFPSEGDVRLIIGDEIVLMTARATDVLTVVRGVDGSAAASHSDTDIIKAIMTAAQISQFVDDAWFGSTGRKPYRLLNDSNVTLTSSDFTFLNEGTSSVADDASGGMTVTINETTGDWKMLHKTAPTPPYVLTAHILIGPGATYSTAGTISGIGGRESSTGEFIAVFIETGDIVQASRFDSPSTFNSVWGSHAPVDFDYDQMWLQFEDDNTDLFARVSNDGVNFFQVGTEGRTAFMAGGADQIIWAFNPRGDADKLIHLRSWIEE